MHRTISTPNALARSARLAGRRFAALLLVAVPALAGCAGGDQGAKAAPDRNARGTPAETTQAPEQTAQSAPKQSPKPESSPGALGSVALPAAVAEPQPPDGKWLTDEKGEKYFVREYPKKEGSYVRLADGRVRLPGGLTVRLEREDDKTFFYRHYKTPDWVPVDRRQPTAEQLAAAAATYAPVAPEATGAAAIALQRLGAGLPDKGQWRNSFDLADMDGDGRLDLVHGPARKSLGPPAIFLGDGQGGFRRWSEARFPRLPYDYGAAAAGDLDGDGHNDLALGVHLKGLMALAGDGKGGFRDWGKGLDFSMPGQGDAEASGFSSRSIALVDWNGDGRLDILALGDGPRLNVSPGRGQGPRPQTGGALGTVLFLNGGDGTWSRKTAAGSQTIFGEGLAVADFDGDGRLDFATGSSATGHRDLVNLGRPDGSWETVEIPSLRPGIIVRSVAAADFDGDGRAELAVGYAAAELSVWRTGIDLFEMQGDGTWSRRVVAAEPGRTAVTALAAGDLDGDGAKDLVGLTGLGATWIFTGDGRGFLVRQKAAAPADFPEGCVGYHVQLADLDGRPGDEILSSFAGERGTPSVLGISQVGRCSSEGGFQVWRAARADASR